MPFQTSVNYTPVVGYAGQIADNEEGASVVSKVACAAIKPGRAVAYNSSLSIADGVSVPASSGACAFPTVAGVALLTVAKQPANFAQYDSLPVMARGHVWVDVEASCAAYSTAYVRHTADSSLTDLGIFDGNAGTGKVAVSWARFLTAQATAGGLALLELNTSGGSGAQGTLGATGPTGPTGPTGATGP